MVNEIIYLNDITEATTTFSNWTDLLDISQDHNKNLKLFGAHLWSLNDCIEIITINLLTPLLTPLLNSHANNLLWGVGKYIWVGGMVGVMK